MGYMDYSPSSTHTIPSFRFTNASLPVEDRFDAWREYMISVADIEPLNSGRSSGLFSVEAWNLGQVVFVRELNPGARFFRTPKKVRASAEDHYYLYLLREGRNATHSYRGKAPEKKSRGIHNVAALHSMADVTRGVMEDMDCLIVFLPRDLFGRATSIMDRHTNENLLGPTGQLISDYVNLIAGQLPSLTTQIGAGVSRSLVELVKANFSRNDGDNQGIDPDIFHTVVKSRIRAYIHHHLHDKSLSVHGICRAMAISRASLYRLFEEEGGIMNYILRRRMDAVLKELQRSYQEKSLPELAEAFGFRDPVELTRNFRRLSGESINIHRSVSRRRHQTNELSYLTEALRDISSAVALDAL